MSKQRGLSHRSVSGGDHSQRVVQVTKIDGYNNEISLRVHSIIDEWEIMLVKENLVRDTDGGISNHYWIIKNMMGTLMEEMLADGTILSWLFHRLRRKWWN